VAPARAAASRDDQIFDVIRERGGRVTAPTRLVVGVLLETDAHLTADDLIATVGRRKKGIAPSTVYRVLQRLSEVGVVEHVHPGDGPAFYHLREGGHAHLVCHRCNAVIDIADGALAGLAKKVDEAHGFALDTHHAALLGLCARCRADAGI
jgi:Fur family transcriptional regulator, ferric uptake regulator